MSRIAVGLASLLLACQTGASVGTSCSRSGKCAPPLVCRFERCRTECAANRDCPAGERCLVGASGAGACSLDDDDSCAGAGHACPSGLLCVSTECVSACLSSADCPTDGECRRPLGLSDFGFCYAPPRDDAGNPVDANVDAAIVIASDDAALLMDASTDDAGVDQGVDGGSDASALDTGCSATGVACTSWTQCCSAICEPMTMTCAAHSPCTAEGGTCTLPSDCCSGSCVMGLCAGVAPTCGGLPCGAASEVCLTDTAACAIRISDGHVLCWGTNQSGVLGDGNACFNPNVHRAGPSGDYSTPVEVVDGSAAPIAAGHIACMRNSVCATLLSGSVVCWGANVSGATGIGRTTGSTVRASVVPGVSSANGVHAGGNSACATTSGGSVWCWGDDSSGELATGTTSTAQSPTMSFGLGLAIPSLGPDFLCARAMDGSVRCAGYNTARVLGPAGPTDGSVTTSPIAVSLGGASAAELAVGREFTCARTTTGAVLCWGDASYGSLGRSVSPSASCECDPTPAPVSSSVVFTSLWSGPDGTMVCGGTASGDVYCWGLSEGRACWLPGGNCAAPTLVPALHGASAVVDARYATCAVLESGTVACYGANQFVQLGDTGIGRSTLTPICIDPGCLCTAGLTRCGGACVDLSTDCAHCGTCGTTCSTGETCAGGVVCPTGMASCGGVCVSTSSDAAHCGACSNACAAGITCTAGACDCSAMTDGTPCGTNATCVGGSCACTGTLTRCAGVCVDTATDAANCGGCGAACTGGQICNHVGPSCGCPAAA